VVILFGVILPVLVVPAIVLTRRRPYPAAYYPWMAYGYPPPRMLYPGYRMANCPRCWRPLVYIAPYRRWYCRYCGRYV